MDSRVAVAAGIRPDQATDVIGVHVSDYDVRNVRLLDPVGGQQRIKLAHRGNDAFKGGAGTRVDKHRPVACFHEPDIDPQLDRIACRGQRLCSRIRKP